MKNCKNILFASVVTILGSTQIAQAHTSFVSSDALAGKILLRNHPLLLLKIFS